MSFRSRAWGATAVVLSCYLSGCNSATGPASLADPVTTAAQAAALDSAFSAPTLASFQAVGDQIHAAPPAMTGAARLLGVARPPRAAANRYQALANQARLLRAVVPSLASVAGAPIIPDSLLGAVYTWNTTSQTYVHTGSGGPPAGVRFLLYAIDPLTDLPATPLNQIGYVDLLDESAGGVGRLHIQVKNTGNTITYLDYTLSGTGTPSSFTATVAGTITNGLAGAANKTLVFHVSIAGNASSVTLTSTFTLDKPLVTVGETLTIADDGTTTTLTFDFTFTRAGETIDLSGIVAISDDDGSGTVNVTLKVNGATFATITGSSDSPTFTRTSSVPLTAEERSAIVYLLAAAVDMTQKVADILDPATRILGF